MDALVTAGGIPDPEDPLFPYAQGRPKALIELAGKPMLQWVLDALGGAETVERVQVIGLDPGASLSCSKPLSFTPDQGSMLENIRVGALQILEGNSAAGRVLSVAADVPAISAEMVDWVVRKASETDHELCYNVIPRDVMETRFPDSKRSFVRLKDVEVCGGDVNVFDTALVTGRRDLWERIVAARKNVFRQAALVGVDTLLLLLLRRLTLRQAEARASRSLKIRGRALTCPYAEIGMDVDKPIQLEILRKDVAFQPKRESESDV